MGEPVQQPTGDVAGVSGLGDATKRFSRRVEDYARYRPGYPAAVPEALRAWGFLPGVEAVVLDVGAGTGLSSEPFLRAGHRVFAVEPNPGMRGAAEAGLGPRYPERFRAVDGRAEATTLAEASVDLVVAGQAFHWFEPVAARAEFVRVLRPGGAAAVLWNERRLEGTPFLVGYERLLRKFAEDYGAVSDLYPNRARIGEFFRENDFQAAEFPNAQDFDFEGLLGRLRSSSYAPTAGSLSYGPMEAELRALFDRCQENGRVRFAYRTRLFAGRL